MMDQIAHADAGQSHFCRVVFRMSSVGFEIEFNVANFDEDLMNRIV